jgi:hypothetical protein
VCGGDGETCCGEELARAGDMAVQLCGGPEHPCVVACVGAEEDKATWRHPREGADMAREVLGPSYQPFVSEQIGAVRTPGTSSM